MAQSINGTAVTLPSKLVCYYNNLDTSTSSLSLTVPEIFTSLLAEAT
jgi:hypothetical protein